MPNSSSHSKSNLYSAVFFSFLIHFMVFNFIILTFTPHEISTKPLFVFLGSILQREDFETSSHFPVEKGFSSSSTIGINMLVSKSSIDAGITHPIDKPYFTSKLKSYTKAENKFLFYRKDSMPPKVLKREDKILGIDIAPPKRTPLKLNRK